MNRINSGKTLMLILASGWLLCSAAAAQTARPPSDPMQSFIAYIPQPGEFRWADSQQHSFRSAPEACQAWLGVMQYGQNLSNGKAPQVNISMLPVTYTSYAAISVADCHFRISSPQGQQTPFIRLAAGCGSLAFTPDPRTATCVPVNGARNSAPSAVSQTPAVTANSAHVPNPGPGAQPYPQPATPDYSPAPARGNAVSSAYSPGIAQGNNPGAPLTAGLGSFRGADFVLTAYGCFRSGGSVLCDFDVTKQNGAQIKAAMLWSSLGLKDENGRLARRHDAFFVANDGSRSPLATLSANPVRLMMEFRDVDAQLSAVSLVNGQDQITDVPVDMADPGQPEGAIPLRIASTQTATAVQAAAAPVPPAASAARSPAAQANVNPVDAANRTLDKANQTVNKA